MEENLWKQLLVIIGAFKIEQKLIVLTKKSYYLLRMGYWFSCFDNVLIFF